MNLNTICNKNSSIEETVTSSPPSLPSSQRKLLPAINTMATSLNNTNSTHSAAATTTTSDASNSLQKTTTVTASTNKLINHHQEECLPSPPNNYYYQQQPSESYNQYHHQNHQQSRQPYQAYQHQQQQQIQSKTPSLPHNTSSQHQPHLLEQQPLNYDSNYYLNSAGQSIFKLGKIAQFAAQNREARINYDHRSNSNNSIPVDENHLTFMINRTIDILNILNGLKSEFNQARNEYENDSELMRKQKAIITDGNASQSSRLKYRKRNKRAAPPGRCHSCDISETPEWRRGPDGARTLCNACGL
ncbi:3658_t:CDS:2, partial [Entrophospora sp. SA101]